MGQKIKQQIFVQICTKYSQILNFFHRHIRFQTISEVVFSRPY